MRNRFMLTGCLILVLVATSVAAPRQTGTVQRMEASNFATLTPDHLAQSFASAVACTAGSVNEIIYQMNGWVTGNELYKALIDPTNHCSAPYPFTVSAVNMPLYFSTALSITVSVDIEEAPILTGTCRVPGNMLAISSDYTLNVPAAGYYNLWIPLDAPIAVNGPFFAGFFIGTAVPPTTNVAVLIDSLQRSCNSYNIWDTAVGFVDLCNFPPEFGPDYNFPGRLAMEVAGTPGGSGGTQPAPQVSLLYPNAGQNLYANSEVWAYEYSGSNIIDYVSFEYQQGANWVEFGRDYDGTSPLRSGIAAAEPGNGFSTQWNFSAIPEGTRSIRVRAVDTLGRSATDQVEVYLEPTPPVARIFSPDNGDDFCSPLAALMQTSDEDLTGIQLFRHDAALNYSEGLTTLHQQMMGDANGNPSDGNSIANGEFGNYYSGPTVGAIAAKLWYDRGYTTIMRSGFTTHTMPQIAESLAVLFKTRANHGTYDELLFAGLKQWSLSRSDLFDFDLQRAPNYWQLRNWAEDEQRAVLLGLGGSPSYWVAVEGFSEWEQPDGTFKMLIANPVNSGAPQTVTIRLNGNISEIYVNGSWHSIDVAVSMLAKGWVPTRELVGMDMNGGNGWSINWTPSGLVEDNLYFFRSTATDAGSHEGNSSVLLRYNCAGIFAPGDYTGDGLNNLADLTRLIAYITSNGQPPSGGSGRGDANCDGAINVADILYYMNYLMGTANTPCY